MKHSTLLVYNIAAQDFRPHNRIKLSVKPIFFTLKAKWQAPRAGLRIVFTITLTTLRCTSDIASGNLIKSGFLQSTWSRNRYAARRWLHTCLYPNGARCRAWSTCFNWRLVVLKWRLQYRYSYLSNLWRAAELLCGYAELWMTRWKRD